jgi:hypothetical protein
MEENLEIVNPQELREEQLLRLVAVFVQRFGGEVTLSEREFEMMEGADIFASHPAPGILRLRLYDECYDMEETYSETE